MGAALVTAESYTVRSTLHAGHAAVLYRGVRDSDLRPVVLKVLRADARAEDVGRLEHEDDVARRLDSDAVVRPLAFTRVRGALALVMEDDGGESLDRHLSEGRAPMDLRRLLKLALGIAHAASELHELGRIIGPQPPAAELPAIDATARFHRTFRRFVGGFADEDHPLVLFLDDLRWADSASLDLLVHLLTDEELRCLFAVGAYRDNEVLADHPLARTCAVIRERGTPGDEIVLSALRPSDLTGLLADGLRCRVDTAESLASVIHGESGGSPFFASNVVEAHGGTVRVKSRPGEGATFTVNRPRSQER